MHLVATLETKDTTAGYHLNTICMAVQWLTRVRLVWLVFALKLPDRNTELLGCAAVPPVWGVLSLVRAAA